MLEMWKEEKETTSTEMDGLSYRGEVYTAGSPEGLGKTALT